MQISFDRRAMLRRLAVLSVAVVTPPWLSGCSRKPSCADVTGLSPDDVRARNDTAAYTETSADPVKKCSGCAQWIGAPTPTSCGGCKIVKGPINPEGSCKLFTPKAG
jgi:hypothetical protein